MVAACTLLGFLFAASRPARAASAASHMQMSARIGRRAPASAESAGPIRVPNAVVITAQCLRVRDLLPTGRPATEKGRVDVGERVLVSGLRPGETRALAQAELAALLAAAGMDVGSLGLILPDCLLVSRAGQEVRAEQLLAAGAAAIRSRLALRPGDEVDVQPIAAPRPLLAPVGEVQLEARVEPPAAPSTLWTSEITGRVGEEVAFTCSLRYRVRITGPALVTRRALRKHEPVSALDVMFQRREVGNLKGVPLSSLSELTGRRAARPIPAGAVLTEELLAPMPAVARGQFVLARAVCGAVVATASLLAESDGELGEVVPARGVDGKSRVMVVVTAPGEGVVVEGAQSEFRTP